MNKSSAAFDLKMLCILKGVQISDESYIFAFHIIVLCFGLGKHPDR